MKPRKAAALALISWYLMVPPLAASDGLSIDTTAITTLRALCSKD